MAAVEQRQPWVLGLVFTLALTAFFLIAQHSILGQTAVSYDTDDDGLIEITSAAQLNAIRWDTDGDGTPATDNATDYTAAFPNAASGMGCPAAGCTGYELRTGAAMGAAVTIDLDVSGYNMGTGWGPIPEFTATLEGNGHTVSGLTINRTDDKTGLFASIGSSGHVRNLKLVSIDVTGGSSTGALAGENSGHLSAVSAAGEVASSGSTVTRVGGLVGYNKSTGKVLGSYAEVAVTGSTDTSKVGGLVGRNDGEITAAYATGSVKGNNKVGGLVGENFSDATVTGVITASYSRGLLSGIGTTPADIGGLVGKNAGTVTNSYYDKYTAKQSDTGRGEPNSTDELAASTGYSGIYANWNVDLDNADADNDAATGGDSPWAFGGDKDYPVLVYGSLTAADQPQPTRVLSAATNRHSNWALITFSRDLQAAAPSKDDFSVTVDSSNATISSVTKDSEDDGVLVLKLASKIAAGQTVTADYTRPSDEKAWMKDYEGRVIADFSVPVTNTLPLVTGLSITSTPALTTETYGAGEHIDVTVEFNVPVRAARLPQLEIVVGSNKRQAVYSSGSGTNSLVFRYTVTSDDTDMDGISIDANKLIVEIVVDMKVVNLGAITDKYGEADIDTVNASLVHDAVAAQSGHKVNGSKTQDSTTPTLSGVVGYDNRLILSYNEPLDSSSVPATGDIVVKVTDRQGNVSTVTVNSVAVDRSEATLTLASKISPGSYFQHVDPAAVTYTRGANPLRDIAGNDAASFPDTPFALNLIPNPDVGHADDFVSAKNPLGLDTDKPTIYRPVIVSWEWEYGNNIPAAVTHYAVSYKPPGEGTESFTWPVDAGTVCNAEGNCTCQIRTTPPAPETPPVPERTCHAKTFRSVPTLGEKHYKIYALDAAGNHIAESVYYTHEVPDNNKPMYSDTAITLTVPENSSARANVGTPVTATDGDGETLKYTLDGDDAASFAIDIDSGQISVASGTILDYEADKNSYSLTVIADDTKERGEHSCHH